MNTQNLISEVSLRCGDPEFKDFEKAIYERAIYRCNREIAKQYGILQKTLQFTLKDMVDSEDAEIILDIPDFKSEYLVSVNGYELVKVADKLEPQYRYAYYMERKDGMLYFNYTMGTNGISADLSTTGIDITEIMSKSIAERIDEGLYDKTYKTLNDVVTICYNIIPNIETEIGEFDIDTKFEEEQIEKAIYYMAKLGIAKYPGENEKGLKYQSLYKMFKADKKSDYDKRIAKDSEWVKIKPWSVV